MTKFPRRVVLSAFTLALVGGALVACSSDSPSNNSWSTATAAASSDTDLVAAAKKEGSVTVYTSTDSSQTQAFSKAFTKKYGIKVTVFRQSSSEIGTTFKTQVETNTVKADVFSTGNLNDVQSFVDDGSLTAFTPSTAAEFPKATTIPGYAYPLYQANAVVGWNTATVPKSVQKELEADPYKGLLAPELKGKVIVIDPAAGGSGMGIYANLVSNYGKKYGWSYLKKLAAQDPAIQTSIFQMSSQITAGTYWATIFATDSQWGELAATGAPLRFAATDTVSASQFYQSVVKDAPHPAAARLYQEYVTSLAGQNAISKATGGSSAMDGWKDTRSFVSKLSWFPEPKTSWLGWQTDPAYTGDKLEAFVAKWDDVFGVQK